MADAEIVVRASKSKRTVTLYGNNFLLATLSTEAALELSANLISAVSWACAKEDIKEWRISYDMNP